MFGYHLFYYITSIAQSSPLSRRYISLCWNNAIILHVELRAMHQFHNDAKWEDLEKVLDKSMFG